MAQTLTNGVVVPEGGDTIDSTGVAAMRALGASVDGALSTRASTAALAAATPFKGRITSPTDAFTLPAGIYTITSVAYAAMVENLPEEWPGTLVVSGNAGEPVKSLEFSPYQKSHVWRTVTRSVGGTFVDWWKIAPAGPSSDGIDPYAANTIRQTLMVEAMGGPIDTQGLGAVAVRIDHGWKNFRDKLLPIFRAAGIVPMVTYNPRDWSRSENDGVTAAEVNGWVANGWIEISNHGATHANATGAAAIEDFVGGSLAEIEEQLPAAKGKVFGFCIPGVSSVESPYDGFINGNSPERWDTVTGKTILKYHAVGYGYLPGTHLRVLDGTIRQGQNHVTLDSATVATAKTRIDDAITQRRGLQFMLHPSLVDESGRITTAQVQEIVDYIVTKRAEGKIKALSSYQMMVADATRPPATGGGSSTPDTGWIDVVPSGPAVDPANPGRVRFRRQGDQVFCRVDQVWVLAGASNAWLAPNQIPPGFTMGDFGGVVDVAGSTTNGAAPSRTARHRLNVSQNDIAYIGYIHDWNGVNVETARDNATRCLRGNLPPWTTDDPFPA